MTREHRLAAGRAELVVDLDDGGRWTSLQVDGLELLSGASVDGVPPGVQHGCFPMAPYAGRLGHGVLEFRGATYSLPVDAPPHAIHGHVFDVAWQVGDDGSLSARLPDVWPFRGTVRQELDLTEDRLTARLVLAAEQEMPATLGYHPWLARRLGGGEPAEVHLSPQLQYETDDEQLPTGRLIPPTGGPYDDCFRGMEHAPRLVWPGQLELTLTSSSEHWVVLSELDDVICIEPQTGPPDAVALDEAAVVPAGGELVLEVGFAWR